MPLRSEIAARLESRARSPEGMWRNMTASFKDLDVRQACESPWCVGLAVLLVAAILLMLMRPPMVRQRCKKTGGERLRFSTVFLIAFVAAAGVPVAYYCC